MLFNFARIAGMRAWSSKKGNYSFLILKDEQGFICSYKNFNTPEKISVIFKDKSEFHTDEITSMAPAFYYLHDLKEAQKSCEKKYKELLLR